MDLRAPVSVGTALLLAFAAIGGGSVLAEDAYVPNQGAASLTIFDIRTLANIETLPIGNQPHEAAARHDARYVFISNRVDDTVSVFDALTRVEIDTDGNPGNGLTRIAVGSQPHGLAVTPDDRHVFVTNDGSNNVTVVDADTFQVVSTVPAVGAGPHMVAFSPDGSEAWIGNINGGDVSLIDVEKAVSDPANAVICATPGGSGSACRIATGPGTEGVAFTKDGRTVYAANGGAGGNTVTVIDVRSRSVAGSLPVTGSPRRVHVSPDGRRAYVSQLLGTQVAVIDTTTHALVQAETITAVSNGLGMDFRSDGKRLYVPNFFSSTVTVVHLPDTSLRDTVPAGINSDSVAVLPGVVRGVSFDSDRRTLRWSVQHLAERYDVYRGTIAGLPDAGACRNVTDPDLTDAQIDDPDVPVAGSAFTYLVGIRHEGIEGVLGFSSGGSQRVPVVFCPP